MKHERIRLYQPGQKITDGRLNQLVRAARRDIVGETPIMVHSVGGSWQITHDKHEWDWWPGIVQARSSDFSDQRYWVRPQFVANAAGDASDLLTWSDNGTVPSDLEVAVENLAESDTHLLRPSDAVVVFRFQDRSDPPMYRHFMAHPPLEGFWARLTGGDGDGYSWAALKDDGATAVSPAVTGTINAKDVNTTSDLYTDVSDGTVVWLRRDRTDDPDEYRFSIGELPLADAQYRVLAANDADLRFKPDWVRAH